MGAPKGPPKGPCPSFFHFSCSIIKYLSNEANNKSFLQSIKNLLGKQSELSWKLALFGVALTLFAYENPKYHKNVPMEGRSKFFCQNRLFFQSRPYF